MKALLLSAALIAAAIAGPVAAQPAASASASVTLTFRGIEQQQGAVLAAVYDSAEAYAGRGRPLRTVRLDVAGAEASTVMEGLAPGRYAIKAFHDLDGDGQMDTNPFGMPTEPFAFSNDAAVNMGPPSFEAAAFTVAAGDNAQAISIR